MTDADDCNATGSEVEARGGVAAGENLTQDADQENDREGTVEITTQPPSVSSDEAVERVTGRLGKKLRSLGRSSEATRTQLRYKPYFEFDATLRKKIFRGEDDVYHGAIVVDGFTGVGRPILKEQVETTTESVAATAVLEAEIGADSARNRANRTRIKVQQRESGKIDLADTPTLVYKPLWLVELDGGDVEVVDATNGQVFGDNLV